MTLYMQLLIHFFISFNYMNEKISSTHPSYTNVNLVMSV